MQYDDDDLEARQLGFVTVHCKHADTPPSNRLLLQHFILCMISAFDGRLIY